ncbi:MAG: hypothetical protein H6626_14045 [Pseudobdellovibrionaceae bacterium]|nr:hypothetical protein [Bdellovibrionales bacterium]USN47292.1 MAG: hypothetical protein H6626_14045 [Pseudobdellovibrionaceae bacterium]
MAVNNINTAVGNIGSRPFDKAASVRPSTNEGPSFAEALKQNASVDTKSTNGEKPASTLKFSNHAVERMRTRGVGFSQDMMAKLEGAVEKAAEKGAKETLVLTDNSALIVSVPNRTVVTVMDKEALRERVFTNVDSTVMI